MPAHTHSNIHFFILRLFKNIMLARCFSPPPPPPSPKRDSISLQNIYTERQLNTCFMTCTMQSWSTTSPKILLRWLFGSTNINYLCFSFPYFAQEGVHPPPIPLGHQGDPLAQLLFRPQILGQIKPVGRAWSCLHSHKIFKGKL